MHDVRPTTLSKEAFGGSGAGSSLHTIRKRLKTTNRKLDRIMEKKHQRALEDAKIDRKIRVKKQQQQHHSSYNHDDTTIRPELETLVLQEEEDAHRRQWALYSEKWSIDRAIFLFGNGQEAELSTSPEEERD